MEKKSLQEEVWDKKKILLGLLASGVLIGGIVYGTKVLGLQKQPGKILNVVKGVQTENKSTDSPLQNESVKSLLKSPASVVQKNVEAIKQEIANLDIKEVASSSPQVQKVLKDIQSIEQYPRNQAKELCENLCRGL